MASFGLAHGMRGASSSAALLRLAMTDDQRATCRRFTGRSTPPLAPLHEAWLVCGRRGGKSFVLATIAVFLAAFKDWRRVLRLRAKLASS